MSSVYCGCGKCPKGKHYGSPEECKARHQIRRYGLYKIDSNIMSKKSKTPAQKVMTNHKELVDKMNKLMGQININTREYKRSPMHGVSQSTEDIKRKATLRKLIMKQRQEYTELHDKHYPTSKKAVDDLKK